MTVHVPHAPICRITSCLLTYTAICIDIHTIMHIMVCMARHENIIWDPIKAQSNIQKHGVTFEDARQMLLDPHGDELHLEIPDLTHSETEERWITIGPHPYQYARLLYVVWTEVIDNTTRIISARRATAQEIKAYVESFG